MPWEHLLIEAMRFLDETSGVINEEQAETRADTLLQKVQKKKTAEKIRLAMTADKETRGILMRDSNRMIQVAVISNPKITDGEVVAIAYSRQVDDRSVLRRTPPTRSGSDSIPFVWLLRQIPRLRLQLPGNWSQPSNAKI